MLPAALKLNSTKQLAQLNMSTRSSKRPLNPDTPKSSSNIDEASRLIALFEQKLSNQTKEIMETLSGKIKDSEAKIVAEINKLNERVNVLETRLSHLESKEQHVNTLSEEVNKLKKFIARQENSAVSCDLRLHGVPAERNQDIHLVFNKICETIGMEAPPVTSIYRINNSNRNHAQSANVDAPIAIKLACKNDRNNVLKNISLYKKKTKDLLRLKHAGIESDTPIYMNELLTKDNHRILKAAITLKKRKLIHAVFSSRGLVYIKKYSNGSATCIESLENLTNISQNLENGADGHLFRPSF